MNRPINEIRIGDPVELRGLETKRGKVTGWTSSSLVVTFDDGTWEEVSGHATTKLVPLPREESPHPLEVPERKPLQGTPQQEAFWADVRDSHLDSQALILEARAGTGKSTSCREAMARVAEHARDRRWPMPRARYLAFNRNIADEFAAHPDLPMGVEAGTMHRFAFRALAGALGSRLEKEKVKIILDLEGVPEKAKALRRSIARLVSLAKANAPDWPDLDPAARAKLLFDLLSDHDIQTYGRDFEICGLATRTLDRSIELTEIADFDDMLWLPAVLGIDRWPAMDFLYLDEAQDTNATQRAVLKLMLAGGGGRLIAVGDPFQAIYQFRGADSLAIERIREDFGARTLPLTVTFRCPQSHVALAKRLVPDFEAHPSNREGTLEELAFSEITPEPGALVLCRANAPLVSHALRLIGEGTPALIRGRDLTEDLLPIVNGIRANTRADFLRALGRYHVDRIESLEARNAPESSFEAVADRVACLQAVAESVGSPSEIPGKLFSLFSEEAKAGAVIFSSVHRAKGLEASRVYFLDLPYKPRKARLEATQGESDVRRNLRYVALTRSLDYMAICDPDA